MLAQLPGVRVQPGRTHRLIARLHRLEVGGQGHLRVDHDVLAASQPDHHVGPQGAVRPGHGDLLIKVAVRGHAGQFHHAPQLQLAPPAAGFGPPERGDQRLRLVAELFGAVPGQVHLLGQGGVGGVAVGV